jgi:hypothetical protein
LRFESLESRAVLSAIGLVVPPMLPAVVPAGDALPPAREATAVAQIHAATPQPAQTEPSGANDLAAGPGSLVAGQPVSLPEHRAAPDESAADRDTGIGEQSLGATGWSYTSIVESPMPAGPGAMSVGAGAEYDVIVIGDTLVVFPIIQENTSGPAGMMGGPPAGSPDLDLAAGPAAGGYLPLGQPPVARSQPMMPNFTTISAGASTVRDLAPLVDARSAALRDEGATADPLTGGQPSPLPATNPPPEGGAATVPAYLSSGAAEPTINLVSSLGGSSTSATEGGYVDPDEALEQSGPSDPVDPADPAPLPAPGGAAPGGAAPGGAAPGGAVDDGSSRADARRDPAPLANDDGRREDAQSDDTAQGELANGERKLPVAELAGQDDAAPLSPDEGGMVELAPGTETSGPMSARSPGSAGAAAVADGKDIPLDNGLGLFHAFELGTAPAQPQLGDPTTPATEEMGGARLTPQADRWLAPLESSGGKQTRSGSDELDGKTTQRSTIASPAILASVFAAIGRIQSPAGRGEREDRARRAGRGF